MALDINENITEDELDNIFKKFDPENEEKCTFMSFYKCMQEVVQKKYH
jgi:Ca2+-binding EF-hand superfamily protein